MNVCHLSALLLVLVLGACGGGAVPVDPGTPGPALPPGTSPTVVLVQPFDDGQGSHAHRMSEIAEDTGARVLGPVAGTPYYRVEVPAGMSPQEFADEIEDDGRVVDVEFDVGVHTPEGDGSTLPAGGLLLGSQIPTQPDLLRIGLLAAQARATGAGVVVGLVDTGVLPGDPTIAGGLLPGGWDFVDNDGDPTDEPNGLDDDRDGLVDEGHAHGTFVASLILAVAPDARILPFRALNSDSAGHASSVAGAIALAADMGVDVVNLSASMTMDVRVVKDAVAYARDQGVVVIASAGNTGVDDVNFPAAISDAVSVTALDAADQLAPFASYGSEVDLCAPGVDLHGAYPFPSGTAIWSGSSFAAALVTGGFALVRERFPALEGDDVVDRLRATAVDVGALNPGFESELGDGRLDLDAATAP
jgi:subtilisin family serine protease